MPHLVPSQRTPVHPRLLSENLHCSSNLADTLSNTYAKYATAKAKVVK